MAKQPELLSDYVADSLEGIVALLDDENGFHEKMLPIVQKEHPSRRKDAVACHKLLSTEIHDIKGRFEVLSRKVREEEEIPLEELETLQVEYDALMVKLRSFYDVLTMESETRCIQDRVQSAHLVEQGLHEQKK